MWNAENKKKNRRYFSVYIVLCAMVLVLCIFAWLYFTWKKLPSDIHMKQGAVEEFDFAIPAIARISKQNRPIGDVDLSRPVTLYATDRDAYRMSVELFGFIHFKETSVTVIDDLQLMPVGKPVGIYLKTRGILVLQSGEFVGQDGFVKEPSSLLREGDYILAYNGESIEKKRVLIEKIAQCNGEAVVLTIERNGEVFDLQVIPEKNKEGEYKLGIWVRDNAQGVGTMTYLTKDNEFGALGHGINDLDTSTLMNLSYGNLYEAEIISIKKGSVGKPGEMTGFISYEEDEYLGDISQNTNQGIYGVVNDTFTNELKENAYLDIGMRQEVTTGPIQILCTVMDETAYYDAEITDIYNQTNASSRGFRIHVTDERLLDRTGGIVQGMSGSPIIQNGKLIGAVTHVLVQDPTRGYGIFIETMLEH